MTAPLDSLRLDTLRYFQLFAGSLTIQTFDDREKRPTCSRIFQDPLDFAVLRKLNEEGVGIFLMVNAGDGRGRKVSNVVKVRALIADFDGQPLPDVWPLIPTLIVESSPGKYHAYWFLAEEAIMTNQQWNNLVESIARKVGSCPNDCKGINRVMRVPGFLHCKEKPFLSHIISIGDNRYLLEEIEIAFQIHRDIKPSKQKESGFRRAIDQLENAVEGERNSRLYQAAIEAGKLLEAGRITEEEAFKVAASAAHLVGLDETEIQSTWQSGLSRGKAEPVTEEADKKQSIAKRVVQYLIASGVTTWRDQVGIPHITVNQNGTVEHFPIQGSETANHLRLIAYDLEQSPLSNQAVRDIVGLLTAMASKSEKRYETAVRVGHFQGITYLDLSNAQSEIVAMSADGWRIISSLESPIRFVRPGSQQALPHPVKDGTVTPLLQLLSLPPVQGILLVAWLIGVLAGIKPYPVLALNGVQGAGKSSVASVVKRLIDPSKASRRQPPKEARDIYVSSQHAYIMDYDNLSTLPEWLSDTFCRLSTGGALTLRTLYSDRDETVFETARPLVINGIPELLERPDLAERALSVSLQAPGKRLTEQSFWEQFESIHGVVLGGLCDAVVTGLRLMDSVSITDLPRMADFVRFVVAAESVLPWEAGSFLATYQAMEIDAAESLLEDDLVSQALCRHIDHCEFWQGTLGQLMAELRPAKPEGYSRWPNTPRALGNHLRRVTPVLTKLGYLVENTGRSRVGLLYSLRKK